MRGEGEGVNGDPPKPLSPPSSSSCQCEHYSHNKNCSKKSFNSIRFVFFKVIC